MLARTIIIAITFLLTTGCATHKLGLIYDGMDAIERVDPPPDLRVYKLYEGKNVRFAFEEMDENGIIKGSCWEGAHGVETESRCFGTVSGEYLYVLWSYGFKKKLLGYPERANEEHESDLYGINILKLRVQGRTLKLKAFFDFDSRSDDLPTWQGGRGVIYNFRWPTLVARVDHTVYGLSEDTASSASPAEKPPAGAPAASTADEVMDKMKALKKMLDEGLITEEEFQQKKKELLEKM